MCFLYSGSILCSQGIFMPPHYTFFSRNYWNYMSASFWSCTRCQKHFGQYSQRDPDTLLPTKHRSQVPTPLQYFRRILRFAWQASHCYELSCFYRWWSNWPLRQLFFPTAGISASRGLTLCKQPNSEIYDLGEGSGGKAATSFWLGREIQQYQGHSWKKIQLLVVSTWR